MRRGVRSLLTGKLSQWNAHRRRGRRRGASEAHALVDAVRAADDDAGVAVTALGERMGLSAPALKKAVDALVGAGRLVERKKRARVVSAV